jgi:hypothetical protein
MPRGHHGAMTSSAPPFPHRTAGEALQRRARVSCSRPGALGATCPTRRCARRVARACALRDLAVLGGSRVGRGLPFAVASPPAPCGRQRGRPHRARTALARARPRRRRALARTAASRSSSCPCRPLRGDAAPRVPGRRDDRARADLRSGGSCRRPGARPISAASVAPSVRERRRCMHRARARARGRSCCDDVVTTGATLREAERALTAGARVLGAATVASTPQTRSAGVCHGNGLTSRGRPIAWEGPRRTQGSPLTGGPEQGGQDGNQHRRRGCERLGSVPHRRRREVRPHRELARGAASRCQGHHRAYHNGSP